uniref:Guanylate cyclase domain-containing protein n=1 Tax=Crocodylus porosus TaxID=8502 RepID=A0A7M4EYM0_CROPO
MKALGKSPDKGREAAGVNFPSRLVQLAAFLPDLLLYNDHCSVQRTLPSVETFNGVLLCAEITGKGTGSACTKWDISSWCYLGPKTSEKSKIGLNLPLYSALSPAGDGLLVLWKGSRSQLSNIITLVAEYSLRMQWWFEYTCSSMDLELQLKIGLSAGHVSQLIVGDEKCQYLLVTGQQVDDARLAQSLAETWEVILSPNCWELCKRDILEAKKIPGQKAVKVGESLFPFLVLRRNASILSPNSEHEKALRRFVVGNILEKIDDNQPLKFFSELRPLTVVFVKLQFYESIKMPESCGSIQEATVHISGTIESSRGKILKISTFGKCCTFLCVFGLPGDKSMDESTQVLDTAMRLSDFFSENRMKLELVSIGITSGQMFCGVVGHPSRHNYTVVGSKVQMAARMLMLYPGLIACDEVTYSKSGLPSRFFKKLPDEEMNDAVTSEVKYEYLGRKKNPSAGLEETIYHLQNAFLLEGRETEITTFWTTLQLFLRCKEGHVTVYEGASGYGKSRLLAEINYLAQKENHRVTCLELTKVHIEESFSAIWSLMAIFFGIRACRPYDREDVLQSKLTGLLEKNLYCLLNDQFLVKFPMSAEAAHMSNETKQQEVEKLFLKVLQKVTKEATLIFIIDEAHYIDPASWDFLARLLSHVPVWIIMSLVPFPSKQLIPCFAAKSILKSPKTTTVVLCELEPSLILEMACQVLGVISIPQELKMFLIQRSFGIPLYCKELLLNLIANDVLQICQIPEAEKEENKWSNLSGKMYSNISVLQLDSFSPSEQILVKCAAVIGHIFTAELLCFIFTVWPSEKMENALRTLINSRVFEFVGKKRGWGHLRTYLGSPGTQTMGSDIAEAAVHFCLKNQGRALRFCAPLLREGAYELLLEDQKRALHDRCTIFLDRKAHKCNSCGGGDFISLLPLHCNVDLSLWGPGSENKDKALKEMSVRNILNTEECFIFSITGQETEHSGGVVERTDVSLREELPVDAPAALHEGRIPLLRQAEEQLVYALAHHYMMMDDGPMAFYYFLESAAASLYLSNNYMKKMPVLKMLPYQKMHKFKVGQLEEAIFCRLKGEVCFNLGQISLAKKLIKRALCLLHKGFSSSGAGAFFRLLLEESKHLSSRARQRQKALAVLKQQICCLSLLWKLYSLDSTSSRKYSWLAALMEINLAEECENNVQVISIYMDFSQFSQNMGNKDEWLKYEMMAIQRSSQCNFTLIRERLLMTAQLTQMLAYSKLCLGHLTQSIQLGKSILATCYVLPTLSPSVSSCRYTQCISVLEWLWKLAAQEETIIALAYFYSACLDLLCDAGYNYRPFEECLQFIKQYETSCILKCQSNIMLSLYASLSCSEQVYFYSLKALVNLLGDEEKNHIRLSKALKHSHVQQNSMEEPEHKMGPKQDL